MKLGRAALAHERERQGRGRERGWGWGCGKVNDAAAESLSSKQPAVGGRP